jgi:hypothetical protein
VLRDLGISAVTIVGGERAVSPVVFAQTDAVVAQVRRIAGQDRYDTAARLADSQALAATSCWRLEQTSLTLSGQQQWPPDSTRL